MTSPPSWYARGLLFENCSCTLVCPGHVHFSQNCTYERCKGYWALRIDEGAFGGVSLAGTRALVAFDTPQRMIDGGWTETIIIDAGASAAQRTALEAILTGKVGGPWVKLGSFVATWRPTEFRTIVLDDEGPVKRISIADRLKSVVTQIRGRDKSRPAVFENVFNQIHAPTQVLALGESEYDDGVVTFRTAGSHGLFSQFEWRVPGPAPAAAAM